MPRWKILVLVLVALAASACSSGSTPQSDLSPGADQSDGQGGDARADQLVGSDTFLPDLTPSDLVEPADQSEPSDLDDATDGGTDDAIDPDLYPLGSFENPIPILKLPFTHAGTTIDPPSDRVDFYIPCGPETNESGGEVVYRLTLQSAATISVAVDDKPGDGIDVDVHILTSPDGDNCIARDNIRISRWLPAGTYWIVVDSWVNSAGLVLAGPYQLSVTVDSGNTTTDTLPPKDTQSPDLAPADTAVDLGPPPTEGQWDNPIVVETFPFTHSANTLNPADQLVQTYTPCAPSTNEGGGEFVYQVTIPADGALTVSVDDLSGDFVDVDVHILTAPSSDACIARDNKSVSKKLVAGTYYVVVDTWVDSTGVARSGPYKVTINWTQASLTNCLVNPIVCGVNDTPAPNGVPTEPAGVDGCPSGMVPVDATFCIDRYEAMLVLDNGGQLEPYSPYKNPGQETVVALSVPGTIPQGYIAQWQAKAACERAGKRLCSDTEWLKACRGSQGWTYPYGPTRQDKLCNDSRTCHPVVQYFETGADWIWSELANPCINQLPDGLAKTGAYSGCVSPYQVYDMMGNLHEWTSNPTGVFRGGFYVDTKKNGEGCLYATTAHNIYHWDYSTGFRCCATR
ncbi:MAG: SUMF1/EgtB/PvdO family nonheme iron enzyme [Myxococcales bacterium]|nr:SUMF1/EgtB/PvdO family nonheme iron enzyme [Myxococcales bacterium]